MKNTKMFLASLCAAFLFSTVPYVAVAGDKSTKEKKEMTVYEGERRIIIGLPKELTYEEKIGKIANYLKEWNKLTIMDVPNTSYGLHKIVLLYDNQGDEEIVAGIYEKGIITFLLDPDLQLVDLTSNGYGTVDEAYKKEYKNDKKEYVSITLTQEEKEKFNAVYKNIIEKFYSENKDKMLELEKALEQDKYVEELWDIVKSK